MRKAQYGIPILKNCKKLSKSHLYIHGLMLGFTTDCIYHYKSSLRSHIMLTRPMCFNEFSTLSAARGHRQASATGSCRAVLVVSRVGHLSGELPQQNHESCLSPQQNDKKKCIFSPVGFGSTSSPILGVKKTYSCWQLESANRVREKLYQSSTFDGPPETQHGTQITNHVPSRFPGTKFLGHAHI